MKRFIHRLIDFFVWTIFALGFCFGGSSAQIIFPSLSGQELLDSLVARYKPASVLDYTAAREVMFTILDNHNDSVTCVYTGYTIYLNHNASNPNQAAYAQGINTEHTWPQSLGATGNAKSDLHHLFPTRVDVNGARGSLPFAEIPDYQTDKWYRLDYVLTTIPTQYIDEYSELKINDSFEPREDHKGNVARAMFYFYTMYHSQASSSFFQVQKDVLRSWNSLDPVDAAEILRTNTIAVYQDGKPNPFVLDTTLIGRAYFGVTEINVSGDQKGINAFVLRPAYPNPFNSRCVVPVFLPRNGTVEMQVVDLNGGQVLERTYPNLPAGENRIVLEADHWSSGFYFIRFTDGHQQQIQKVLLLR